MSWNPCAECGLKIRDMRTRRGPRISPRAQNREELATLSSVTDIWHTTLVGRQFPDAILPGTEAFDLVAGPLN